MNIDMQVCFAVIIVLMLMSIGWCRLGRVSSLGDDTYLAIGDVADVVALRGCQRGD